MHDLRRQSFQEKGPGRQKSAKTAFTRCNNLIDIKDTEILCGGYIANQNTFLQNL